MKILVMGGTRFVGKSLVEKLLNKDYEIDIFTRGNKPTPVGANLIKGDRNNLDDILKIKNEKYDYVFDISGRELDQTKMLVENIKDSFKRYIYVSSAGVYEDLSELPITEDSPINPNSRHIGKFNTEMWLIKSKIPFTSFRPTYIYGPNNYNKVENWFFERIYKFKRIPIPFDGSLITQLGHVSDLSDVMIKSINYKIAENNIYNCSGNKGITIKGLILICAEVCNIDINEIKFEVFDYTKLDPKARKAFPIRLNHYLTSINKLKSDIEWEPKFDLLGGLKNSYDNDFKHKMNELIDDNADEILFAK